MTIGERLREARLLGELSARELSGLAGVAAGHVALLESGEREHPRSDTLVALARVLGVSLDWLVSGNGETPTVESVRAAVDAARAERQASTGTEG